jgi:hypothetical protein
VLGRPIAFLKDGGSDLSKGSQLLGNDGFPSLNIADVSHVIANLLKHRYSEHPVYLLFLSECGKASKMLKQTVLACFAPPKVSTKARFMNVHRLVRWAQQVLCHSPAGRANKGSILEKLRASIGRLPQCKIFIENFLQDTLPLLECQKILKTQGLKTETYEKCMNIISTMSDSSSVKKGFIQWMDRQMEIAETFNLADIGLPITSDSIESLFGIAKTHGVGPMKDPNRIALHIPVLCGKLTQQDAYRSQQVTTAVLDAITRPLVSLTKQRRDILPNPGTLEQLAQSSGSQFLELIPGSKNRDKNTKSSTIPSKYKNFIDPQNQVLEGREILKNTFLQEFFAAG